MEYESVLTRNKILALIKSHHEEVDLILKALVVLAQKSETYYLWRPNLADENDNFIVEAAVATGGVITKFGLFWAIYLILIGLFMVLNPTQNTAIMEDMLPASCLNKYCLN